MRDDRNYRASYRDAERSRAFLDGEENGFLYKIPFAQLLYIEVVDKKSFLYTAEQVCYSPKKLYQLEERLRPYHFIRIGKSQLLNIDAIQAVSPTLSGRFEATLNGRCHENMSQI